MHEKLWLVSTASMKVGCKNLIARDILWWLGVNEEFTTPVTAAEDANWRQIF